MQHHSAPKPPGCFSRFGCFSVLVVLAGLLICLIGWQRAKPNLLPHFTWPSSLPSLLSHSIAQPETAVPASNEFYAVTGAPTITVHFIDAVLSTYHSPAAGLGQALYADGVTYGIDPVYALAFFQHESQFGTRGEARASLSLGNMRCITGFLCRDGYAWFASWQQGFEQWYRLIRTVYVAHGLLTLDQIVPVYAPAGDGNNIAAYIAAVKHDVDTWRKGQVQL